MTSLIGGFSFLFVYFYFIIPLAPAVYIFIKWRSYRDGDPPDHQLGMKVILYYFKTLAYHVLLASLAVIFFGLLETRGGGSAVKVGLGLLVSGGIIYVAHSILVHKLTNTADFPLAARVYGGFNLVVVGLVSMVAFVFIVTLIFESGYMTIQVPLAFFIVYTIAWVCQTVLFCKPSLAKKISLFGK